MPLIAKAKPTYKYYDLTKPTAKGWADQAQFYEYVKGSTPDMPGTVSNAFLPYVDPNPIVPPARSKADVLGTNLVLFPLEKNPDTGGMTQPSSAKTKNRCFLFSDFDAVKKTAVFRGVGDFLDLNDADLVPLGQDLEIW